MLIITDKQLNQEIKGAEVINISGKTINSCTGCYNCWVKTPGSCVIKDEQVTIYEEIAAAREIVYVCRIRYGCYDVPFKIMLERCLPLMKPFLIRTKEGTRHQQRSVESKDALIISYGAENEEEKEIFTNLVMRTALNMSFDRHKVVFAAESEVDAILQKEVSERWTK